MRLTRRDAVVALSVAGVGAVGATVRSGEDAPDGDEDASDRDAGALTDAEVATLVAAAEVLYPSAVANVESFVRRYVRGRADADRAAGIAAAVAYLDDYAAAWYDADFADLDPATRSEALRNMDADTAPPDPDGSDVERVRYYVVNELLFALYASPTGSELVGLENPQGHPGGLASYRRGPQS
jgi:hypothetical protein